MKLFAILKSGRKIVKDFIGSDIEEAKKEGWEELNAKKEIKETKKPNKKSKKK